MSSLKFYYLQFYYQIILNILSCVGWCFFSFADFFSCFIIFVLWFWASPFKAIKNRSNVFIISYAEAHKYD